MSTLDNLLSGHVPPPVPAGLAERAVAEAIKHPQEQGRAIARRRDPRGGWKRPLWIGAASFGLAFTSAVAATVVSGGRIEIPVVQPALQEVVEAVPVFQRAQAERAPKRVAEARPPDPAPLQTETATAQPQPAEPGQAKARVMQKLAMAKQVTEQRRAAGLPTPRADRIERQAKAIVAKRQAAGLPTPTLEEVEAGLALRELRRMWLLRRTGRIDPAMLSDQQLMRIADRLPPEKRERFMALSPDMQRQLVAQQLERWRARRMQRQQQDGQAVTEAPPAETAPSEPDPAVPVE